MPQTIHLLDSLTIDKIAAGEVIESPASCVKELIDNALDADARSLRIEIQLGGRELILVQDDGNGMSLEDLKLSCERHATSKILTIEDLDSLTSRGFRGEALSSIASISKTSIRSRERSPSQETPLGPGYELLIEGGHKKQPPKEVTAPHGTQVVVRDLFYNVPARRKFLKPPAKNALEVLKTVKQMALVSPHVSFLLISDGKTIFQAAAASSLQERIKNVLAEPYRSSSLLLHVQKQGLTIEGLLVLPEEAKKNRSGQYIFVNGRPITSLMLSGTLKAAYATSLQTDEFPQFTLSLSIDPERVDMNVHPQKKEVRFADEEWIRTELYEAASYALFACSTSEQPVPSRIQDLSLEVALPGSVRSESAPFLLAPPRKKSSFFTPSLFEEKTSFIPEEPANEALFHYHTQMGPYSLVTLSRKRTVIIHLVHALHATLSQALHKRTAQSSQLLLQPEVIELGPLERDCLEDKLSVFAAWGFSLSQFGKNSLLLESIPSFLDAQTAIACIKELLEEKIEEDVLHLEKLQSRLLQVCKRSHPELTDGTIERNIAMRLIENWIKAGEPACTLSGKKVSLSLEHEFLESLF